MSDGCWHRVGPLLLLQLDPPSKAASRSSCNLDRRLAGSVKTPRPKSTSNALGEAFRIGESACQSPPEKGQSSPRMKTQDSEERGVLLQLEGVYQIGDV